MIYNGIFVRESKKDRSAVFLPYVRKKLGLFVVGVWGRDSPWRSGVSVVGVWGVWVHG